METTPGVPLMASIQQRSCFPKDFIFGTASSAYQYEGAAKEGGRGPSIWDTFTHKWPGRIKDGSNGDIAVDFYHQYKEDIKIMKKMGFDAFRFSISWSRILPSGKLRDGVNKEGIKFYSDLIDELLANGLTPFVTLFHWDLPQALEEEYGGFLSALIVADFRDFVDVCFWEFGDRVKYWITLNEPWAYCVGGYVNGKLAPGRGPSSAKPIKYSSENIHTQGLHTLHRAFNFQQELCNYGENNGDPGTEPYTVAHNLLLAHAATVELYKQTYQPYQNGKIGITLLSNWMIPYNSKLEEDRVAAQRAQDFMLGWFMDPLKTGDYPCSMKKYVGSRLPTIEDIDSKKLKGSFDFIGINYYTARFVADAPHSGSDKLSYTTDPKLNITPERNGEKIGPKAPGSDWLYIYPKGLYDLLKHMKDKYSNPLIYVTENGACEENDVKLTLKEARDDKTRQEYHPHHLCYLKSAIDNCVNVKGYFAWSLLDNFEWSYGYTIRFGLIHVDYKNGCLTRYPKDSAKWFSKFLKKDT